MAKKQQLVIAPTLMGIRGRLHSLIMAVLVAVLIIAAFCLTRQGGGGGGIRQLLLKEYLGDDNINIMQFHDHAVIISNRSSNSSSDLGDDLIKSSSTSSSSCDLFSGKWVFDNQTYPLYKEKQCTFMSDQLACEKFGRKDLSFQNWRWQPHQCQLPRFNGTALLEKLRNKRLVYVGDSLNRNQWVSMVCLVESSLPAASKKLTSMHTNGSLISFKLTEYNASVEFYWAPLIVESNSDDPVKHRLPDRIVRIRAIEKHAKYWTNADILVFNSYLWWRRPYMKALWGSFENPSDGIYKEVEMLRIYEMALKTWSDWLEIHINRNKSQLFFMSMSPTHERAKEWGADSENCYNETEAITKEGYWGSGSDPKMMHIVETVIEELKTRGGLDVKMLNITQLTEYRKEGHPSIYRKQWEALTEEQVSNPSSYADCIHWCLPGVPDVWNELLYTYIVHPQN